jgi:hypothetical protein
MEVIIAVKEKIGGIKHFVPFSKHLAPLKKFRLSFQKRAILPMIT